MRANVLLFLIFDAEEYYFSKWQHAGVAGSARRPPEPGGPLPAEHARRRLHLHAR